MKATVSGVHIWGSYIENFRRLWPKLKLSWVCPPGCLSLAEIYLDTLNSKKMWRTLIYIYCLPVQILRLKANLMTYCSHPVFHEQLMFWQIQYLAFLLHSDPKLRISFGNCWGKLGHFGVFMGYRRQKYVKFVTEKSFSGFFKSLNCQIC